MASEHLVGICGIYCGACMVYRAYKDNDQDLIQSLTKMGFSEGEVRCEGCTSDIITPKCGTCIFKECVKSRGISYCFECPDLGCEKLIDLSERRARVENKPHLRLCPKNLEKLKEVGTGEWLAQQDKRWSCESCGKRLHWYTKACPSCGTEFYDAIREAHAP
jgi:hypothetical protein